MSVMDRYSLVNYSLSGHGPSGSRSFYNFTTPEYKYFRDDAVYYKDLMIIPEGEGYVDCYSTNVNIAEYAIEASSYFTGHDASYTTRAYISLLDSHGVAFSLKSGDNFGGPARTGILGFSIDRASNQVKVVEYTGTTSFIRINTFTLPSNFNSTGRLRLCAGHQLVSYAVTPTTSAVLSGKNDVRSSYLITVG